MRHSLVETILANILQLQPLPLHLRERWNKSRLRRRLGAPRLLCGALNHESTIVGGAPLAPSMSRVPSSTEVAANKA